MSMREDALAFVEENDVKFVRLAFCDIFGRIKSISIMASELEHALVDGVSFDASAVSGFTDAMGSDLMLYPDPSTMAVLPWRPQQGRVARLYCDIQYADGRPFDIDGRRLLRDAVKRMDALGFKCRVGLECEFYLFTMDEAGRPTQVPHDQAGYLDFAPLDKGENVRREVCLSLEQMGIQPVSSHHEGGPGQNEIGLKPSSPLAMADNYISFCNVVRTVAARYGLFASFLPKPLAQKNGSGLHLSMSLFKGTENAFFEGGALSADASRFVQGILDEIGAVSAFLNPLPGSYTRLGHFDAPVEIAWSNQNRAQLLRIPAATGSYARMELRSPDPATNPYVGLALLMQAGMNGIRNGLTLQPEGVVTGRLPANLGEAVALARGSEAVREALPERFASQYLTAKQEEYERMVRSEDARAFEVENYFAWV